MTDEFTTFFSAYYEFAKPYRSNKYGVRPKGSNKYVQPETIFQEYAMFRAKKGLSVDVSLDDVKKFIDSSMPSDQNEERVPCRTWIMEWLRNHRENWQFNTGWTSISYVYEGIPRNKTMEDVKDAIMEDVYREQLPYRTEEVKTTLNCIARDASSFAVQKIFKGIAYDEKMVDPSERFLHGIYDYLKPEEDFEIFSTLMRHWAWICKRRMLGNSVVWHIWPNLYGATGLGKTTLLSKLCSPMADYTSITNISMLFDSTREIAKLSEYYVLIFDELAVNADGEAGGFLTDDNLATMKSILTSDYLDVRVYGTQRQSKQKITFAPISSANNHLYDIIFDPQSMRRFFEFHCTAERPKSYDEINKYLERSDVFWRGIDENRDRGYWDPNGTDVGKEISKIQASYYPTRTTTSLWMKACNVVPGDTKGTAAYRHYLNWCRETGHRKPKTMEGFVADLAHMLPEAVDSAGKVHLRWTDEDDDAPVFALSKNPNATDQYDALIGEM